MSYNDLRGLAEANMSDQMKLDCVIEKWLEMNGQGEGAAVTWKTILDVIKGPLVHNKALAIKIYEYLKEQSGKCTCFNYYCNIRRTSNINYILSQCYMEYNRDELAILILTISIILTSHVYYYI